jgi:FKBP-type peptidyl-prolyl cis-trans isomerase
MKTLFAVSILALAIVARAADPMPTPGASKETKDAKAPADGFASDEQRTLYALGVWVSRQLNPFSLSEGDLKFVEMGLHDAVLGEKPKVDLEAYGDKLNDLAMKRLSAAADKNKAAGKTYADKVAKEKGAKTLPNGAVIVETEKGKGKSPKASDTVKVNYEGKLIDGTIFDSSFARKEPAEFPLNGVIPCWTEAVQKMKIGGKARIVCPSNIAYGDKGRPGIPPGATLDFRVELLEIKAPERAEPEAPKPAGKSK